MTNQFDDSTMFRRGWNSTTFRSLSWNMSCNTPRLWQLIEATKPLGPWHFSPCKVPLSQHIVAVFWTSNKKKLAKNIPKNAKLNQKVWFDAQDVFQRGWFCIFSTSFFTTTPSGRCHAFFGALEPGPSDDKPLALQDGPLAVHTWIFQIHPERLTAGSPTSTHEKKGKWSEPGLHDYVPC